MATSLIEYTPVINFKLRGALRQFGKSYPLAVRTPAEAVKALCVQIPGFERFISERQVSRLGVRSVPRQAEHWRG